MNITPQPQILPIATSVNIQTDALRRENNLREVIAKPEATNQAAAEKGVASERERAKTPGQSQDGIDFDALRKHAEERDTSINGSKDQQSSQQGRSENNAESGSDQSQDAKADSQSESNTIEQEYTPAELQQLKELKERDREVRAHELAHATVGGSATGAPSYSFQIGADGKQYAVGGEVSVDLSPVSGDSSATIAKMKRVKAAALAPANPSTQDFRIAANASQIIVEEQAKLAIEEREQKAENIKSEPDYQASHTNINETENSADSPATDNATLALEKLQKSIESIEVFSKKIDVDFNSLAQQTLASDKQEASDQSSFNKASSQRSADIDARAERIGNFYNEITKAYGKPASYHFILSI